MGILMTMQVFKKMKRKLCKGKKYRIGFLTGYRIDFTNSEEIGIKDILIPKQVNTSVETNVAGKELAKIILKIATMSHQFIGVAFYQPLCHLHQSKTNEILLENLEKEVKKPLVSIYYNEVGSVRIYYKGNIFPVEYHL